MCIVKVHPEPEPITAPNRPVLRIQSPSSSQSHRSSLTVERRPASTPYAAAYSSPRRSQQDHQQQAIVISQVSSRLSHIGVSPRPLSQASYPHGDGTVPTAVNNGKLLGTADAGLESAQRRRSSSMTYAKSPRQSGTSFRTTRERIVVVDEGGRRREYYRKDDSGTMKQTHVEEL